MKGLELAAVSVAFVGTWRHTSGLLMQGCIRYSSLVSVFVVEEISSSSCGSQLCTAVKWTYRKMFFSTLNKSHLKKYTSASANTMFWTFLVLYVAVKPPFSFGTTFPQPYNFSIHDIFFFRWDLIYFLKCWFCSRRPNDLLPAMAARCFSTKKESWRSCTAGNTPTREIYVIQPHIKKPELSL